MCLGEKFFLSDGYLDAHRRLTEPSDHRINGEKASGFEGGYPELQFHKRVLHSLVNSIYFGKLDFYLLILFKSPVLFSLALLLLLLF